MSATLAELEARIAALEANQADYRAVMATVNALSTQTRERLDRVNERFDEMRGYVDGRFNEAERTAAARHRSVEEHLAELKDLILQLRDT